MDHDFYNDEHDIYSPVFSSDNSILSKEDQKENEFFNVL